MRPDVTSRNDCMSGASEEGAITFSTELMCCLWLRTKMEKLAIVRRQVIKKLDITRCLYHAQLEQ